MGERIFPSGYKRCPKKSHPPKSLYINQCENKKNCFRVISQGKKTAMEEESKPSTVKEGDQHINLKVNWKTFCTSETVNYVQTPDKSKTRHQPGVFALIRIKIQRAC